MELCSNRDPLIFSGKLKITSSLTKFLVGTKCIRFSLFAAAIVNWKDGDSAIEVPLFLIRFGMTSWTGEFTELSLTPPPIVRRVFSQTRTDCKLVKQHSLPLRAEEAGRWQRGQAQGYINTIIPYITGCSRSLVCIISSSQVGSGSSCGWFWFPLIRRRRCNIDRMERSHGFSWRRPRPWWRCRRRCPRRRPSQRIARARRSFQPAEQETKVFSNISSEV